MDKNNNVRVIWIQSKSVCVIEAKLEVYKHYEESLSVSTIFIHHALEDHDEIFKRVWNQKLGCLYKEVLAAHHYIPFDLLETILINAGDEILSMESIKNICFEVCIQKRDQRVGTVNDQSYKCFFKINVSTNERLFGRNIFKRPW